MCITKKMLVLTLFQGFWCQRWEFPNKMYGLSGSCVEIPCVFSPHRNSGTSNTVWYLYSSTRYLEIFNSQESSSLLSEYRDRTSLVPGTRSCSLRIDPVRRDDGEEYYYPGIAERLGTNAWSISTMTLQLHVIDNPPIPRLSGSSIMIEEHFEVVGCSVEHTCGSSPPSLTWNKPGQTKRHFEALSGGHWRETSHLRYVPTDKDDGTQIQCTATFHNGKTSQGAAILNILYAATGVRVIAFHTTGGAMELQCSFVSSNPDVTHYSWFKDGNRIISETGQILVLENNEDKSGSFSCIAHNTVGSSTSADLQLEDENKPDLLLILGVLSGVVLLLLLVLIVYFYTRQKRKPDSQSSPIFGEISSHFPDETLVQEHQYGNIQVNPRVFPASKRSPYSSHTPGEGSYAIYSNEELIQAETGIEYSTIAHTNRKRREDLFDNDRYEDSVNYAEIKY
ncbi:B-cell receptor CD22-like isoform X2 [Pyxicephalus adspersus]|uniref:B-cell receptor CD22-like isoform X2 n=1 Tax=Pyxicephalus adspersus TaxID=30357 RepID=UPI003B5CCA5D